PACDRDRDMEQLDRLRRIGRVDDHRSVELLRATRLQRILRAAPMGARERDGPSIGINDDVRLVRIAPLQVDVSHAAHVLLLAALADAMTVVRQDPYRHHRCDCYGYPRKRALARGG